MWCPRRWPPAPEVGAAEQNHSRFRVLPPPARGTRYYVLLVLVDVNECQTNVAAALKLVLGVGADAKKKNNDERGSKKLVIRDSFDDTNYH